MNNARTTPSQRRPNGVVTCTSGITTLEFAFITPIMLLIMMAVVEFAMIMFTMAVMESATSNTARLGKTGYTAPGSSRQEQIVANIKSHTSGLLDPNKIVMTSMVYATLDKVGTAEPYTDSNHNGSYNFGEPYSDINGNGHWDSDMGQADLGDANDVVVYTVTYPWPVMTPILRPLLGSTFNITVRTVVKNEPFNPQS